MEELLKVSIIIPVHNSEGTLIRCINSILSQDYKNIECILIENGSSDNSRCLCSKYAEKHENIIFRTVEAMGVSGARNVGLSLATGDVIGFCDADDFLEVDAISSVVNEFIRNPKAAAVFGGFYIGVLDNDDYVRKDYRGVKKQTISATRALRLTLVNDSVMGSVWNKYYRVEFLNNLKFDKGLSFCEDMHFNAMALSSIESTYSVKVINTPLYCYMENPSSVTHDAEIFFDENNELKYIVALKKIDIDCNLDSITKSFLRMKIACFSIDFLVNRELDQSKKKKLIIELKRNYFYLLKNILVNNWKWNVKRAFKSFKFLTKEI